VVALVSIRHRPRNVPPPTAVPLTRLNWCTPSTCSRQDRCTAAGLVVRNSKRLEGLSTNESCYK
jgi:hypothetical protein